MTRCYDIAVYAKPHTTRDGRLVPGFVPEFRSLTFAELVELLTRFLVVPELEHKLHLPAWAPHQLRKPHRKLANVESVSCLVYDYDDGTPIQEAHRTWSDWPHIVHTSWSHTPEHPKFRVVLPLEEPIPVEHYVRAWLWGAERARRQVDRQCKDASRLFFLPAVPSKAHPRYAKVHDAGGHLLDLRPWGRLPEDPEVVAARERKRAARRRWEGRRVPAERREKEAARLLREDPDARLRAAELLGARVVQRAGGRVAIDVVCPACARPDVWFPVDASKMRGAACNHQESCGWRGPLFDLLVGGVAA